jgi:hypothetical protein
MRRKRWQKESMKGSSYLRIGFFRSWIRRGWDDSDFIMLGYAKKIGLA